jgi:transposase
MAKIQGQLELQALKLLDQGYSIERISKELPVGFTAVRNWLIRNKLKTKVKYNLQADIKKAVLTLAAQGLSNNAIATKLKTCNTTVSRILLKAAPNRLTLHQKTVKAKNLPFTVAKVTSDSRFYEYTCEEAHTFKRASNNFLANPTCPTCNPISRPQLELYTWVRGLEPATVQNAKVLDSKLEIDIYVPNKSLGIEYCGEYWHSEKYRERSYHKNKHLAAQKKEIQLLQFFEQEYLTKPEIVKSMIKAKLGLSSTKVFARKLQIKQVSKEACHSFMEKNHLQGKCPFSIAFGLYNGEELISCASLRVVNSSIIELARFATKLDTSVTGGFSKLLKRLIKWSRDNNYKTLLSYANLRYSEGNVYSKTGFVKTKHTALDWFWLLNGKIYNRRLSWGKKDAIFREAGYLKVFGTGHIRFELDLE